jgi:hypothetical protein
MTLLLFQYLSSAPILNLHFVQGGMEQEGASHLVGVVHGSPPGQQLLHALQLAMLGG